ncbi:MAG: RNA polymerase sigma factor [Gammaproteobacteria bacterium]|nr:RNA polymerase sigma factor [Gammaproteobacteria bacterium]MBT5153092.1 RNA polymerase sigma factor [Gammaproteobacteria bacterium]MBT6582914.1 RNA polymerase sigma factor [Gammaproteobacteria bacterium]MBT6893200.1 RNA polymerase sigma factor [Gammaproteobacteria bacterium]MBT7880418.1 RNA polymerase sigma factor [Gammaproteobacteria bacterium]
MHADDLKLARSLVTGDEKMFNQFFEQFFPRLYRFAFSRLSDESIVEDVVQSTLMNAMRGMKNYRGEASMFTWLCQICRNEIATIYRKQGKSVLTVTADDDAIRPILESLESESATPEQHYLDLEARNLLAEVLDFLPGNYGKALEWKYVLGLSVTEIANRLGLTELATQSLLARARTSFRNALNQISPELKPLLQE